MFWNSILIGEILLFFERIYDETEEISLKEWNECAPDTLLQIFIAKNFIFSVR